MNLWKDSKRAKAQELIEHLLSQRDTGGGWPFSMVNEIAFAELGSSSSHFGLTEQMAMKVLGQMPAEGKRTVDGFEAVFEERLKAEMIAAKEQDALWRFFMPISIAVKPDIILPLRIQVLGKDFRLLSLPSLKKRLDKDTIRELTDPVRIKEHTGASYENPPKTYLSVSVRGSSQYLAWNDVSPAFDALRGLIELSFGFLSWRLTYGRHNARRKVPHPPWMVARKSGSPVEWLIFETEDNGYQERFDLDKEGLSAVRKNAAILKKEPQRHSTLFLLADCMRLYSQAMDARSRHLCFLGFWQLAEAITRSETFGGKTDKVASRIAWHGSRTKLVGSGYSETLLALGKKRNNIVHRGIHGIEDIDVNVLKLACDVAIGWLFGMAIRNAQVTADDRSSGALLSPERKSPDRTGSSNRLANLLRKEIRR